MLVEWGDFGHRLTLTWNHVFDLETIYCIDLENHIVDHGGRTICLTLKEDDAIGKGCGENPEG
jgi:hypothetical protein